MPTVPRIARGVEIGVGPHLRLTYSSGSPEEVTIASGTKYILEDNTTRDLLKAIDDALTSAASVTNASVTLDDAHKIRIALRGAADVTLIEFLTTQLLPVDLGFALNTTSTSIAPVVGSPDDIAQADYRSPAIWCPSTVDFDGVIYRRDAVVSLTADDGSGVDDYYSGHRVSTHDVPEVFAALMLRSTTTTDHSANVPDLTAGDTNATLEEFLIGLSTRLGGARESIYWTDDVSQPTTNRAVRIGDSRLLSGVEGWIVETNRSPLFFDLKFELLEVD